MRSIEAESQKTHKDFANGMFCYCSGRKKNQNNVRNINPVKSGKPEFDVADHSEFRVAVHPPEPKLVNY